MPKIMRIIEFRGIRIDNKDWIYGWLFKDVLTGILAIQQTSADVGGDRGHLTISTVSREVDPESVGQYINWNIQKTKIYEGDICKTASGVGKVICFEQYAQFMVEMPDGTLENVERIIEKMGNVIDNPEMLKL